MQINELDKQSDKSKESKKVESGPKEEKKRTI